MPSRSRLDGPVLAMGVWMVAVSAATLAVSALFVDDAERSWSAWRSIGTLVVVIGITLFSITHWSLPAAHSLVRFTTDTPPASHTMPATSTFATGACRLVHVNEVTALFDNPASPPSMSGTGLECSWDAPHHMLLVQESKGTVKYDENTLGALPVAHIGDRAVVAVGGGDVTIAFVVHGRSVAVSYEPPRGANLQDAAHRLLLYAALAAKRV